MQLLQMNRTWKAYEQSLIYKCTTLLQREKCNLGDEAENDKGEVFRRCYSSFTFGGMEYKIGDHCYLKPGTFPFNTKPAKHQKVKPDDSRLVSRSLPFRK